MNGKRKTRPDDERAIGAPVPGGGLTDYLGKDQDLELVRRKQRELGPERLRCVVRGEGDT